MRQIYIQLTAKSPLAIRSDHAPGGADAASYIPGTAFAGSLAAVYRLLYPKKEADFKKLFLDGKVFYPDLYPAIFKNTPLQTSNVPVYPLPRTAQSCKRHPGFLYPEDKDNDNHGVRDSLIDWALFKLRSHQGIADPARELHARRECEKCHAAMESFSGYYRRSEQAAKEIMAAGEAEYRRLQTHTGIDRDSGTVQEGILYNRKVFEEGMCFWGAIRVADDLVEQLDTFLSHVGHDGLVRVGTGRSRGMGQVKFNVKLIEHKPDAFEKFCQRLDDFHAALTKAAGELISRERYFFAITLHSPLILLDEVLRYRGTIDGDTLKSLLKCDAELTFDLKYWTAQMRRLTGWQDLWGLPRMNEYAIDAGSVFLFSCNAPQGTPENKALLRQLFELEAQGMGKRRIEGFGRVCISDQFHQERDKLL